MHIQTLSARAYISELYRPWKLFSFIFGMIFLIYGALNFEIPDWDVGISLIMGPLTYMCAPWSVRTILYAVLRRQRFWWGWILIALVISWFAIDGVYVLYHTAVGNIMLRWDNLLVSSPSYLILGFLWMYTGSLKDLLKNIRNSIKNPTDEMR